MSWPFSLEFLLIPRSIAEPWPDHGLAELASQCMQLLGTGQSSEPLLGGDRSELASPGIFVGSLGKEI